MIDASSSVRIGNLAQEQGGGNLRWDDCSDKSCFDGYTGLVRPNVVQCLEAPIPHNSHQYQNKGSCIGAPNVGSNAQSLVEIQHRYSTTVLGGGNDFKQAEEAISLAPLWRIRVDHSREEDCGFPRIGFSFHGESSYVEANSDSSPSQEMQSVDLLQRGYNGILKYMMIWKLEWNSSKDLLKRLG